MTALTLADRPTAASPVADWSDYGFRQGQSAATVHPLPAHTFNVKYSLEFLGTLAKGAMKQSGTPKLRGDRLSAFQGMFREGFVRRMIERTGMNGFCLVVTDAEYGSKNVKLTPDAIGPFWTLRYLDAGLDPAHVLCVKDPFTEVTLLCARQWPSQS